MGIWLGDGRAVKMGVWICAGWWGKGRVDFYVTLLRWYAELGQIDILSWAMLMDFIYVFDCSLFGIYTCRSYSELCKTLFLMNVHKTIYPQTAP